MVCLAVGLLCCSFVVCVWLLIWFGGLVWDLLFCCVLALVVFVVFGCDVDAFLVSSCAVWFGVVGSC